MIAKPKTDNKETLSAESDNNKAEEQADAVVNNNEKKKQQQSANNELQEVTEKKFEKIIFKGKLRFPIYCVQWLKGETAADGSPLCIIGGGGGKSKTGIPNFLLIAKYNKETGLETLSQYDANDEIIWTMAVNQKDRLIAFGAVHAVYIVSYSKDYKTLTLEKEIPVKTNDDDPCKKFVAFSADGKRLAVVDDRFDIHIMSHKRENDGSLSVDTEIRLQAHKDQINDIDFSYPSGKMLCSVANDKTLRVWDVETGNVILKEEVPSKLRKFNFRNCRFARTTSAKEEKPDAEKTDFVYALHTAMGGPTYISKYAVATSLKLYTKVVHKKPCTTMIQSDDGQHMCLGVADGGICVLNARNMSMIQSTRHMHPHDFAVSCCDIILPASASTLSTSVGNTYRAGDMLILSGSAESTVAVTHHNDHRGVQFAKRSVLFMLFFLLLATLLYYYYQNIYLATHNNNHNNNNIDASTSGTTSPSPSTNTNTNPPHYHQQRYSGGEEL